MLAGKKPAGFNAETSKEIPAKRDAHSKVFANADGTFTRRIYAGSVHFRRPDGQWAAIDTTLRKTGNQYTQAANDSPVTFAATADNARLVSLAIDSGHTVSFGIQGAAPAAGETQGNEVTYRGVRPDSDVEFQANADGVREVLVLRSAAAPRQWVFPLELTNVTPAAQGNGAIALKGTDGRLLATIPAGFMEDSKVDQTSGKAPRSDNVRYELITVAGKPALRMTLEDAWLDSPDRQYPVRVDPPVGIDSTGDTFVSSAFQGNHGSEDLLQVGTYNGGDDYSATYVKFPAASTEIAGNHVIGAGLGLYNVHSWNCTKTPVAVHAATVDWSEGTLQWPGAAFAATPLATKSFAHGPAGCGSAWEVIDLEEAGANLVDGWANGAPNRGLVVRASTTDNGAWKKFASRDSANAPYLDVAYAPNVLPQVTGQFPPNGFVEGTLTPELYGAGFDPDAWPNATIDYRFKVCGGTPAAPSGCRDSGWINASTWTVPAGTLKWGGRYFYQVSTGDGRGGTVGATNYFTTATPQPLITSHLAQNSGRGFDAQVGNYTTDATDAVVPTAGPDLAVRRTYNSLDPRVDSAFGVGWSSRFDMEITPDNEGPSNVVVTYPDGQEVRFGINADGTYAPPQGRYATLAAIPAGGWTLTDKSATIYTFDAAGRLRRVTDNAGLAQTLEYGADGKLAALTNTTSGRTLSFTWTNGHVTAVATDPVTVGGERLRWTYTYTGGRLTKVCPPTSATACTTYDYATGSHYRSMVLNAEPHSYWRLGESTGTVADSAVEVNQGNDNATYANTTLGVDGALAGAGDTAAAFNGTSSNVKLPKDLVHSSTYLAVSLWFKTTKAGVLFSYLNKPIGTTPTNTVPALYVGNDGKLRGTFWAGGATPITSANTVADDKWHHVVLSGAGNTQTMYLDGTVAGIKTGQINHLGMVENYVGYGWFNNWPAQPAAGASYFEGSIDEVAFYTHPLGKPAVKQQYASRLEATGLLSKVTLPSGKVQASISYDINRDRVSQVTDAGGGVWKLPAPTVKGSSAGYRGEVVNARPRDYWRFGEPAGAGAAKSDISDPERVTDGSYTNVTLGVPGAFPANDNTAATFNGTSSQIRLPSKTLHAAGSNASVELWFKTKKPGVLLSELSQPAGTTPSSATPVLYIGSNGKLHGTFWTGVASPIVSSGAVNDDKWHHVVLAAEALTPRAVLYLDGDVAGTKAGTIQHLSMFENFVGYGWFTNWPNMPAAGASYFTGSIDEVAVYDRTVSASEVDRHFEARGSATSSVPLTNVVVTDPAGKTLSSVYDTRNGGRPVASTDALGKTRTFGYDTGGYLNTIADANQHVTILGHDARGNEVSRSTCRTLGSCQTSYSKYFLNPADPVDPRNDKVIEYRDARSATSADFTYATTYTYTADGDIATTTTPKTADFASGRTTTTAYTAGTEPAVGGGTTPPGLVASITDPRGGKSTYTYYSSGDVARTTDPVGLATTYQYDKLGRSTSRTEVSDSFPAGLTTTTTYDGVSRPATVVAPPTADLLSDKIHTVKTTYTYDADGNHTRAVVTDTTGGDDDRVTTATFDSANRLETVTDPEQGKTTLGYDRYGNRASVIDTAGTKYQFKYSPRGELLETILKDWIGDPTNPSAPRDIVLESRAYDSGGRVAAVTDAMGRTEKYRYHDDNRLREEYLDGFHNPDGTTRDLPLVQYTYDAAGNITGETRGNGTSELEYTIDAAGRATSAILDPGGLNRSLAIGYNANDDVIKETISGGGINEFDYDLMGRRISATVRNGTNPAIVTTWDRDQRGLTTREISPRGKTAGANPVDFTISYKYDSAGQPIEVMLPPVKVEQNGGAPSVVRPTSRTSYDAFGNAIAAQDLSGTVTTTSYDKVGRPRQQVAPAYTPPGGGTAVTPTTKYSYDDAGRVSAITDPSNRTIRYTYDDLGRLVQQTDPPVDGATGASRYSYDLAGELLSATDPTGAQTRATYDDLGRQVTATEVERRPVAANFVTTMTYDDAGNLTSTTSPTGATTRATYNPAGQETTVTDALENSTAITYDAAGRVSKVTDPMGLAQTTTYDPVGRITQVADLQADGSVIRAQGYAYNAAGDLISATKPTGQAITYGYDALQRLTQQVEPVTSTSSITTTFGYDAAGRKTRFTDGRSNATIYTHNTLGLPESTIEPATAAAPNAADRTFTTAYDAAGQVTKTIQPGGVTTARTIDALGRVIAETGSGAEAPTTARQFGYDLAGHLTSASAPGGTNTYTYNDRGLLLTTAGPSGQASYTYDAEGRPTNRVDAAGTATFGYNKADQLATAVDPTTKTNLGYTYNKAGDLTEITYGTSSKRAYSYDNLHRLAGDTLKTTAGATQASITYGYDTNSRLTSKTTTGTAGATANTYAYDFADRLTSWTAGGTTTNYDWDAAGNRTTNGARTSSYDQRNRLLNDGDSTYTYAARGTLATKTTGTSTNTVKFDAFDRLTNDGSKTYTYDSLDRLRTRGSTNFTYNDLSNNLVGDGPATYGRDPFGQLLSTADATTASLAYTDQHGDLVASFNPTTTSLTSSVAFDPFGLRTTTTGQQNRIGFQGGWTDPDTGKLNAAARWYDPTTGTFTSRDTWDIPPNPSAAANRYGYGTGDPLGNADPTGHVHIPCVTGCAPPPCVDIDPDDLFNKSLSSCPQDTPPPGSASASTSGSLHSAPQSNSGGHRSQSGGSNVGNGQRRSGPSRSQRIHRDANTPAPRPKTIHTDTLNDYDRRIRSTPATKANLPTSPTGNMYGAPVPILDVQTISGPAPVPMPGQSPSPTSLSLPSNGSSPAPTPSPSPGTGNTCVPACDIPWWQNEYLVIPATFAVIGGVAACIFGACEAIAFAVAQCVYTCPRLQSFGTWIGNLLLGVSGGEPSPGGKAATGAAKAESTTGKVGKAVGEACSFDPETRILLADGTSKKIKDVGLGDEVAAGDEATGEMKGSRKVVALHSNPHDGDLVDVTIVDGQTSSRQAIRTTDEHHFWDATLNRWVRAAELTVGHDLISSNGRTVRVQAVRPRPGAATMLNLTIEQLHTYYVLAGTTSVLVHNTKCRPKNARSKQNTGGGIYARRQDAVDAAKRDRREYPRARIRMECAGGGHVHLDIFNKHGQIIETRHYRYRGC